MSKQKTHKEYVVEVSIINPNIEVIGEYINAHIPILHKCKIDGHEWYAKPNGILAGTGCPVCSGHAIGNAPEYLNSIWASEYRDFYAQYMTEEQMKTTMPHSGKKIELLCPNCGEKKKISPNVLFRKGLCCICEDGQSFPNKFVYDVLRQLNIDIQQEYSPEWAGRLRYDDYLKQYNIIIENHGIQHYKERPLANRTLQEEKQNDLIKYNLAKENGITEYIVVDCRIPRMEWIKKSIMESKLPQILNFAEDDIDWTKAMTYAAHSLIKDAATMFNDGTEIPIIANELQRDVHTIRNWLKFATQIGWCVYIPKKPIKLFCIETGEILNSKNAAAKMAHTSADSISKHLKGEHKYAGRHPQTNEPLHWKLVEDVHGYGV